MADNEEAALDPMAATARSRRGGIRERIVVIGTGVVIAAVVGSFLVWSNSNPGPEPSDGDNPREVDLAGPYDGLESLGLNVTVDPDFGLAEATVVSVVGEGFTPGATVGIVQCWRGAVSASVDDCDLGTVIVASADGDGRVDTRVSVRRYISLGDESRDCAQGGLEESCILAVGNVSNYDESGGSRVFFDPELPGQVPPLITVEPAVGITDGQTLTVSGSGFQPGEIAIVTQCVIGGRNGTSACFGNNPTGEIQVGDDGAFTVTLVASRLVQGVSGEIDCFDDSYGCRLAIQSTRSPNPTLISYDGSFRPPPGAEFTVTPNAELRDLSDVRVRGFDLRVDGGITVAHCVDQGPEGLWCQGARAVEVRDGQLDAVLTVRRWIWNGVAEPVDCAGSGRRCFVSVSALGLTDTRLPLRFEAGSDEPVAPVLRVEADAVAEGSVEFEVDGAVVGWVVRLCASSYPAVSATAGACLEELARVDAAMSGSISFPDAADSAPSGWSVQLVPSNQQLAVAAQWADLRNP